MFLPDGENVAFFWNRKKKGLWLVSQDRSIHPNVVVGWNGSSVRMVVRRKICIGIRSETFEMGREIIKV